MDAIILESKPKRRFSMWSGLALAFAILLVIGGIVAGVVLTLPSPTPPSATPTVPDTVTPTVTTTSMPQTLILSDPIVTTDQCLQFAKLKFPNVIEHAACGGSGVWTYYLDPQVMTYNHTDYEYCIVAASSLGSNVVGGNGGCSGVQVSDAKTIKSNGYCITKISGLFQWGDCQDAFTFGVT